MSALSSLAGVAITALVSPLILRWLSASGRPPRQMDGFSVVEYSLGYCTATLSSGLLFLSIAALAHLYPGSTNPKAIPWVIGLFSLLGLISVVTAVYMRRATVFWNDHELSGCDLLGRRHRVPWEEIESVETSEIAQGYRIRGSQSRNILISEMMIGYPELLAALKAKKP